MGYKLELNEPTIIALAEKVAAHHEELQSILHAGQNFAAARSEPLLSKDEIKALHSQDQEEDVTGQVDVEGLPWDERIHSSNKKKTAKGVWVARRGVDDITRVAVIRELRTAHLAPSVDAIPVLASSQVQQFSMTPVITPPLQPIPPALGDIPAHIAEAPQSLPPVTPAYTAPEYTAPVVPPVPTVAAPVVTAPAQYTITDVFGKIQPMFAANVAEAQTYINSLTQRLSIQFQVQVQTINDIAGRPDMIAFAMQLMANDGK